MTDWMRQMVGLSAAWSGVIQDTASTSTLVALICARERASDYALASGGLQGGGPPLTVYVSAHSHSSVEKAALLAGFGREHVRAIEVDATHYAIRPDALRGGHPGRLAKGLKPCAIVGTSGTTTSTAFDPLAALAELAKQHGTWLHVDAAMAGSAMILPECRPLWDGIEGADSLVFNPHKWLGAAFDCSLYYVRDPEHLVRVMSTNPSYLAERGGRPRQEPARLGHPAGAPLPCAEAVVPDPRAGCRAAPAAPAARPRQRALARAAGAKPSRCGACWPRWRCRRSASGTSPPVLRAKRSIVIPRRGRSASTARARPT